MAATSNQGDIKRLFRSRKDKILAGVCGGLADYFSIDPVLMRILWVIISFFGGVGLLLYIAAAIIIPQESDSVADLDNGAKIGETGHNDKALFWGSLLVIVGIGLILKQFGLFAYFSMMHIPWQVIWAVLLILLGIYIMFFRNKTTARESNESNPSDDAPYEQKTGSIDEKQVYRSPNNKMIAGVCGGLAEYFNIDATIVRLIYVLLSMASVGMGLIAYLVMALIFPERPNELTDYPESEFHS